MRTRPCSACWPWARWHSPPVAATTTMPTREARPTSPRRRRRPPGRRRPRPRAAPRAPTAPEGTTAETEAATDGTAEETTDTADEGATATTGEPVAADDSLEPVTFGFHNLEGGAVSLPEIRHGFEEGIRYVNEELGGINGHPIEIESCNLDLTPESSVNCANQFVEAGVDVAVQGVDVAADAALPVLKQAGIAEIALAAFTTGVNSNPGRRVRHPGLHPGVPRRRHEGHEGAGHDPRRRGLARPPDEPRLRDRGDRPDHRAAGDGVLVPVLPAADRLDVVRRRHRRHRRRRGQLPGSAGRATSSPRSRPCGPPASRARSTPDRRWPTSTSWTRTSSRTSTTTRSSTTPRSPRSPSGRSRTSTSGSATWRTPGTRTRARCTPSSGSTSP